MESRNILLKSLVILILILAVSCNKNEREPQDTLQTEAIIHLTAQMPQEEGIRLEISPEDSKSSVKWKDGDKISLLFVKGELKKTVSHIPVTDISADGKSGSFAFSLPAGITYPYDLYGIYGAEFQTADNAAVQLKSNESENLTLGYAAERCAMRFELKNITGAELSAVTFQHLGSIMDVEVKNASNADITLSSIQLVGDKNSYNWIYGASNAPTLDLMTGIYTVREESSQLDFQPDGGLMIPKGTAAHLYRWFIPTETPDESKNFGIRFNHADGIGMGSLDGKALQKGKHTRLKLVWDGTNIKNVTLPPPSDLMAHWPMNGNTNDVSGNGYHGTIVGGVTLTADHRGVANGAYLFNGTDGYIDVGDWTNGGAMTITCWARWDAYQYWSRIIDLGNGEYQDNIVLCNSYSSSSFNFHLLKPYSTMYDIEKEKTITLSSWAFYVASVDESGLMKIYKNGELLESQNKGFVPVVKERTLQYIGKSNFSSNNYFKGAMDDIRIYNRALTIDEVWSLYVSTK